MRRVVATGTFDLLHPGHLFYLEESRKLGDELFVIVARSENVRHKPKPVIPDEQRLRIVSALKPVDHAVLGDLTDMWRPIREIAPSVITIGFNQHFSEEVLRAELVKQGIRAGVVRIPRYDRDTFCSSRRIVEEILRNRGCTGPDDREGPRT